MRLMIYVPHTLNVVCLTFDLTSIDAFHLGRCAMRMHTPYLPFLLASSCTERDERRIAVSALVKSLAFALYAAGQSERP